MKKDDEIPKESTSVVSNDSLLVVPSAGGSEHLSLADGESNPGNERPEEAPGPEFMSFDHLDDIPVFYKTITTKTYDPITERWVISNVRHIKPQLKSLRSKHVD
jgi:hypothetical protein